MDDADKVTYAPFVLGSGEKARWLLLSDRDMLARIRIFEERSSDGWLGNGYDWTSIARVVVEERLPDLRDELNFDPEAGTFVAIGSITALRRLGEEMKKVFDDEASIRDILGRAELD
jgi:Immunity protein 51